MDLFDQYTIFISEDVHCANWLIRPERIYNPITAMGFSAMFTFQLDNINRRYF